MLDRNDHDLQLLDGDVDVVTIDVARLRRVAEGNEDVQLGQILTMVARLAPVLRALLDESPLFEVGHREQSFEQLVSHHLGSLQAVALLALALLALALPRRLRLGESRTRFECCGRRLARGSLSHMLSRLLLLRDGDKGRGEGGNHVSPLGWGLAGLGREKGGY